MYSVTLLSNNTHETTTKKKKKDCKLALVGIIPIKFSSLSAPTRCVFSSDPAVSSSIFVGAEREENLIKKKDCQMSVCHKADPGELIQ